MIESVYQPINIKELSLTAYTHSSRNFSNKMSNQTENVKILIVDDRPENLFALEAILEDEGIEIIQANSGREALKLASLNDFALIFADVQMPEMDGFEMLELLRANEPTRLVPVIFVTAISKEEKYVNKGYSEGAVDYLFKPLNPNIVKSKADVFVSLYKQKMAFESQKLKAVTEEKTKLLDELSQKINEVTRFNYVISHNLRASIASIIGLSDIINIPSLSESEKLKIVDYIRDSSIKMDELVRDLGKVLDASSPLDLKREWVLCNTLIQNVIHLFESQIKKHDIDIKVNITDEAKEIFTIKSYLESIIYNLISNSIKYKSPNIKTEILIDIRKRNEEIVIAVSDNGIGIDLSRHGNHLFGLYKRFNLEVEGKGLGLLMTKTQVEALGGNISVESALGIGSIFTIILPIQK